VANNTNNTLKKISVVVPTYNRQDNLKRTLDGLSIQTFLTEFPSQMEVVVVSDGSTDGTADFVPEYAKTAPYALNFVQQENGGPSRARNRGITEATGEVIIFIDDDVEPTPDLVLRHWSHHAQDAKIAVVAPMVQADDRRWKEPVWVAWEHTMLEKQYYMLRSKQWETVGPHHFYSGNASVRREHLNAVNGFDICFTRQEDVELAQRLEAQCGVHFAYDDEAKGMHRPERTLASWLKIPRAYGQFDIQRALRDPKNWQVVQHQAWSGRNRLHRLCARLLFAFPALLNPLRTLFLHVAEIIYKVKRPVISSALLSIAYNLTYLEGAATELPGGWRELAQKVK
jgi:glycosyltransferase involved in cell wall biosynthesis